MPAQKSVLVVEDDESMLDLIRALLLSDGFACDWVTSGTEALERLAAGGVDLLVLDLMLPGMDGMQLLAEINRWPSAVPPVIVVTGMFTGTADERKARAFPQVKEFLRKPFDNDHFISVLHRILAPPQG